MQSRIILYYECFVYQTKQKILPLEARTLFEIIMKYSLKKQFETSLGHFLERQFFIKIISYRNFFK